MAMAIQVSFSCKIPGCEYTSPALSLLQQHCMDLHPGCVVPGMDTIDGVEKMSGDPFDCGLTKNWLITKDDEDFIYGMPESMLTKDRWIRSKHDQMTDYLDLKLTAGCAGAVVKQEDGRWKVLFQSCTINNGDHNPNHGHGGQIVIEHQPQFEAEVKTMINLIDLEGTRNREWTEDRPVRMDCNTGELWFLPVGEKRVKHGWKISRNGWVGNPVTRQDKNLLKRTIPGAILRI